MEKIKQDEVTALAGELFTRNITIELTDPEADHSIYILALAQKCFEAAQLFMSVKALQPDITSIN